MGTEKLMLDPDHNNQLCYQILLTFFLLISLPLSLLSASLLSPIWSACIIYISQPVEQAFVHALGVAIQDKFTAEVQDSWIALYKIVQLKMEEGMAEGMAEGA